jgi:hypothetical protein
MPLILETNYSKKIGLPGYSSHQFMVTLRTEITDLATVPAESHRLYELLQHAVDSSLQNVGWLPQSSSRNGSSSPRNGGPSDRWACSEKQRDLILRVTDEHRLDKNAIEQLALDRFGKGVRQLNKLEASGLIDELLEQTGQKQPGSRRRFGTNAATPARAA